MLFRMGSRRRAPAGASQHGFTLIELAVVIMIVAVITSIALANFIRFRTRAAYVSCTANQRHILEATTLYISQNSPGTIGFDVAVLQASGWVNLETCACPRSTVHAQNDYHIDIVNNSVNDISCRVLPAEHHWELP